MNAKPIQGIFAVIDSFAIRARNEFYLLGEITDGKIQPGWYVNISLNSSLDLTLKIKGVEDIDFAKERNRYKLIIVDCEPDLIEIELGLNIGNETVNITVDGED